MRASAGGRSAGRLSPATPTGEALATSRGFAPTAWSRQLLAAQRAGAVEAFHRLFDAGVERDLQGGGHAVDDLRQPPRLRFREPAEHIAAPRRRSLASGLADADSKANEVGGAERAD